MATEEGVMKLRTRIAELEQAIRDANDWVEGNEGCDLRYYAYDVEGNPDSTMSRSFQIIEELINND